MNVFLKGCLNGMQETLFSGWHHNKSMSFQNQLTNIQPGIQIQAHSIGRVKCILSVKTGTFQLIEKKTTKKLISTDCSCICTLLNTQSICDYYVLKPTLLCLYSI